MEPSVDAWKHKVGDFILSFASIEHNTYQIMFHLLNDDIFDELKDQGLSKRIDICMKLCRDCDALEQKWKDRFLESLEKAKDNIHHRNLIAHNPMFVDMYHNNATDKFDIIAKIMAVKKQEKYILYEELEALVTEMADVSNQLSACMSVLSDAIHQP